MESNVKRITILLFDFICNFFVGMFFSDKITKNPLASLIVIGFITILVLRIFIDFKIETHAERLYKLSIKMLEGEKKSQVDIQQTINDKMLEALKDGNIQKYETLEDIKKRLGEK